MISETWIALVFFFTISWIAAWLFGRKFGATKIYERTAGTFLKRGDLIPEWVVRESWKLISNNQINRGGHPDKHKRNVLFCESIVPFGTPQNISIEAVSSQRLPEYDEVFYILETGELEFNRQPNL